MSLNVGIVGCGNISETYLKNAPLFKHLNYVACSDLLPHLAEAKAAAFGLEAVSTDALYARDDIDIILNLSIPAAHGEVSMRAIEAGKHVFSEKPMAINLVEAQQVLAAAKAKNVRIGIAPDTVLGPGIQTARSVLDSGKIGTVISGLAAVMSHGMEHWHPNPEFFFKRGGGPVLDLGPYYITALVQLLGPVRQVQATGTIGYAERLVTAEGPMKGKSIKVEAFTTLNALLSFESGSQITFMASWDVWSSDLRPIDLHGTEGTLRVPDPNNFGRSVAYSQRGGEFTTIETSSLPFGADNRLWDGKYPYTCYRGLGMADLAHSLEQGVPHRCSGEIGLHVVDVLLSLEEAATSNRIIDIATTCARPDAFTLAQAIELTNNA